jgi:hypothetical protein
LRQRTAPPITGRTQTSSVWGRGSLPQSSLEGAEPRSSRTLTLRSAGATNLRSGSCRRRSARATTLRACHDSCGCGACPRLLVRKRRAQGALLPAELFRPLGGSAAAAVGWLVVFGRASPSVVSGGTCGPVSEHLACVYEISMRGKSFTHKETSYPHMP